MDPIALRAHAHQVLRDASIPELPNHYRGKVRDNYDLPDGRRIIIASDRLSAFDRILCAVPFKGQVLTQTARFWFEAIKGEAVVGIWDAEADAEAAALQRFPMEPCLIHQVRRREPLLRLSVRLQRWLS